MRRAWGPVLRAMTAERRVQILDVCSELSCCPLPSTVCRDSTESGPGLLRKWMLFATSPMLINPCCSCLLKGIRTWVCIYIYTFPTGVQTSRPNSADACHSHKYEKEYHQPSHNVTRSPHRLGGRESESKYMYFSRRRRKKRRVTAIERIPFANRH